MQIKLARIEQQQRQQQQHTQVSDGYISPVALYILPVDVGDALTVTDHVALDRGWAVGGLPAHEDRIPVRLRQNHPGQSWLLMFCTLGRFHIM